MSTTSKWEHDMFLLSPCVCSLTYISSSFISLSLSLFWISNLSFMAPFLYSHALFIYGWHGNHVRLNINIRFFYIVQHLIFIKYIYELSFMNAFPILRSIIYTML